MYKFIEMRLQKTKGEMAGILYTYLHIETNSE